MPAALALACIGLPETPLAGLDPATHVFPVVAKLKTWMPGSSPGKGIFSGVHRAR